MDQGDFCHPLSSFSTTGARHAKHTKHTTPLLLQQSLPLQLSQSRLETPLPSRPESSGTRTKVIFVILSVPVAALVQDIPSIPSIPLHFYSNNHCHCNCLSPVFETPLPSRPESSGTRTKVIFVILSVPLAQLVQDMPSIPSIPLHFYSNNHCHCKCLSPVLKHHYHQGPKALEHGPRWFLSSSQFL